MMELQRRAWLELIGLDGSADRFEVTAAETRLGRSAVCDYQIKDPLVSRLHARLLRRRNEFYIQDLNSANGTWVNGLRITRAKLRPGDLIHLGEHELVFQAEAQPVILARRAAEEPEEEQDTGEYERPGMIIFGGYCPACETPFRHGANFCLECGQKLEPATLMKTCPACGTDFPPEARYCMECGRPRPGGAANGLPATAPFRGPPPPRRGAAHHPPEVPARPAWPVEQILPSRGQPQEGRPGPTTRPGAGEVEVQPMEAEAGAAASHTSGSPPSELASVNTAGELRPPAAADARGAAGQAAVGGSGQRWIAILLVAFLLLVVLLLALATLLPELLSLAGQRGL